MIDIIGQIAIRNAWAILLFIGGAVGFVIKLWFSHKYASKADFEKLDGRMERTNKRLDSLEADLKQAATKEDIANLKNEITQGNTISKATNEGLKRLEAFFLKKGIDGEEKR